MKETNMYIHGDSLFPSEKGLQDLVIEKGHAIKYELELLRYAVYGEGIPREHGVNILEILGDIKAEIVRRG